MKVTMEETVKKVISEIENILVGAMNTCRDEYEVLALVMGIAVSWDTLADNAAERWTPKKEDEGEMYHGEEIV